MSQNGHFQPAGPVLPWRRWHVDMRVATPLTAREREVAHLILGGLTNRQIADELAISGRTVGAHVQNILNKLGASNRAQIAAWAATYDEPRMRRPVLEPGPPSVAAAAAPRRFVAIQLSRRTQLVFLAMTAIVFTVAFPADHAIAPPWAAAAVSSQPGVLVYQAHFDPAAGEFHPRYVIGEPAASDMRIRDGAIEFSVLKPGGNTGTQTVMPFMSAYFAEFELSVKPGSSVQFWIAFNSDETQHLLDIDTVVETMQLSYFTNSPEPMAALGPAVAIEGLQTGRRFAISALVRPPLYRVFLDGVRVIDVTHAAPRGHMAPAFATFGEGGSVRVSAIRVYSLL